MKAWFLAKNSREQYLLMSGGILLIIATIWYAIIAPINAQIDASRARISQHISFLKYVADISESGHRHQGKTFSKEKLAPTLVTTSAKFGVVFTQVGQDEKGVSVKIESVEYEPFLRWIEYLEKTHNIKVVSIAMSQSRVTANLLTVPQLTLR